MLLGFDIGGTKCAVVIGREEGDGPMQIMDKIAMPTTQPPYDMIEKLFAAAGDMLAKNGFKNDDLAGIGISCGGPLSSKKGLILSPPNLPGWDNIPMVKMTKERFGRPALLQNDANACAVAEWKYGAGRGYENVIFLTFGTGMGAGLILNGRLYSGTTDFAGEVGHLRLSEMGPVGFGKAGSFEGWCSGGGIAQLAQLKARERIQVGEKVTFCDSLDDLPKLTAKIVADAAHNGDELAIDVYTTCAEYLGRGLSLLIDILNPEIIIMGSIYGRAKSLLDKRMMQVIEREAYIGAREACRIVPAGLGENIGDMAALSLATMAARGD